MKKDLSSAEEVLLENKTQRRLKPVVKNNQIENPLENYHKEVEGLRESRKLFFDNDMTKKYVDTNDIFTGEKIKAKVVGIQWLQRTVDKKTLKESYKPKIYNTFEEIQKERNTKLKESNNFNPNATYFNEYIAIPPNQNNRQLYLSDLWELMGKAFYAYNHYPLAKAIIDLKSNFIVGDGFSVSTKNEQLQEFLDNVIKENELNTRLLTWQMQGFVNGELLNQVTKDDFGNIKINSVDPAGVYEIITEPTDISKVYGYWLQYLTATQIKTVGDVKTCEYVVKLLPPDNVFHLKYNVQENEKRGRSDLQTVIGHLRLLEQLVYNKLVRSVAESAYTYVHTINGTPQEVDTVAQSFNSFPNAGSSFFTNDQHKVDVLAYNGANATRSSTIDEVQTIISIGLGVPKEWTGAGGVSTRASAIVATEPAVQMFRVLQKKMELHLKKILKHCVEIGMPNLVGEDFEISFPEIAQENVAEKISLLMGAEQANVLTHERVSRMIAKELDITEYDYQEEQNQIKMAREKDAVKFFPTDEEDTEIDVEEQDGNTSTSNDDRRAVTNNGKKL